MSWNENESHDSPNVFWIFFSIFSGTGNDGSQTLCYLISSSQSWFYIVKDFILWVSHTCLVKWEAVMSLPHIASISTFLWIPIKPITYQDATRILKSSLTRNNANQKNNYEIIKMSHLNNYLMFILRKSHSVKAML